MPNSLPPRPPRALPAVCWTALAGLFVWVFADVLFAANNFVYRDVAHFYYPLFKFISGEWAAGQVPLWNPHENLGVPLAAMGTSSVFYPGKLIFALGMSYDVAFKAYLLGHLLLAAGGAYWLARRWGHSMEAAAVCALSYAFGGNVLFQYCNVVFLVSAAWLPFAMGLVHRLLAKRRFASAVWLGLVLALMVTGGDPQMAYHTGLIAAGYAVLLWRADRREADESTVRPTRIALHRLTLLIVAAAVGFALAAVQIFPTWELSRMSQRATHEQPRSLAEWAMRPGEETPDRWDSLLAKSASPHAHQAQLYQFSVGPWRLAEYVWPNVSGRQFPEHRRWLDALPSEGLVWAPSLYMGLLPLVLALAAWRLRGGQARTRWLSWMVLLSVVASFGVFGLGWLVREAVVLWDPASKLRNPAESSVGDAFGGLYWLMAVVLPGYVNFRYPAKLLVLAALGLSLLAAGGWDDVARGEGTRRTRRWFVVLGVLSLLGIAASLAVVRHWDGWMDRAADNPLFGPLQTDGAWRDLFYAPVQTLILCGVGWWLVSAASSRKAAWPAMLLVAVTAADLALANGWMVAAGPAENWRRESRFAEELRRERLVSGEFLFRVDRPTPWWPKPWRETASPRRQADGVAWDRDTLMPRYPLSEKIDILRSSDTMVVNEFATVLSRLGVGRPDPPGLDCLNVKYLVLPVGRQPPDRQRWREVAVVEVSGQKHARLWVNRSALPRAWIVRNVEVLPPLESRRRGDMIRRTDEVFFPDGQPRDFRQTAVVESDHPLATVVQPRRASVPVLADECQVERYASDRVVIDVHVRDSSGLLVLSDLCFPGWTAEVHTPSKNQTRQTPILRTNRILRGVVLPPGHHRVTFRYEPKGVLWGAAISSVSLGLLVLVSVAVWWRGRGGHKPAVCSKRL